jgi:LacI family transcriptional regulator
MAAKILIERLESEDDENQNDEQQDETYKTVIIESHLIERESTN